MQRSCGTVLKTSKIYPGWQDRVKSIAGAITKIYGDENSADILILVGKDKEPILAHRFVLITRSPVIAAIFENKTFKRETYKEKSYDAIEAFDMSPQSFRVFLRYLYTNILEATLDNVDELLSIAKLYEISVMEKVIHKNFPLNVLKLNDSEIAAKKFRLSYDINANAYQRGCELINGWASLAYVASNMTRTTEESWRMVYLSRKPGTENGEIAWKIDLSNLNIKHIKVNLGVLNTFSNGKICATVHCGKERLQIPPGETKQRYNVYTTQYTTHAEFMINEVIQAEYLMVHVQFSGGTWVPQYGDIAWQQSQLFRTSLSTSKTNMDIEIELN